MTPISDEVPVPGLDPAAAQRWLVRHHRASPWLHEEVAGRMIERLQWFRDPPTSWLHWEPVIGGLEAHRRLADSLPQARSLVWLADRSALSRLGGAPPRRGWGLLPWRPRAGGVSLADEGSTATLLWANMVLHHVARPQTLLRQWHRQVETGGFLMFSCLGPDSLGELRAVYARLGWPSPTHVYTDMHDWGDMLVHGGFAEPVMDMERIALTFSSASAMLEELRGLGRNLNGARFPGMRGRGWRQRLEQAIEQHGARSDDGRLCLTFEIIYGHAFKSEPRRPRGDSQSVSVDEMRAMLRGRKP
jgi:malonyl-CoA O-methyltransferase